ncbi:zinc finger protein 629 [Centropristis striata]|uniref:zinc finger protein 629 n=1 Tax=Centropristis striata TaxID=184440 RepID=UPI0027DEC192|nr:zinc finger protein 629 [Centropristis striata]
MSAGVVNLQAQVESVLGALVKAATVELTKLFESRYRASALEVDVGRTEDRKQHETLDSLSTGDTTRSIGVQVDEDIYSPSELPGTTCLPDGDCLRGGMMEEEEEEVVMVVEGLLSSDLLLAAENGQVDPEWSPLKEQVLAETVDMVQFSGFEAESPADKDPQTEVVLHVSAETWTEPLKHESTQSSPAKQKPLVVQPDTRDTFPGEKIKFVCPLLLRPESPAHKPERREEKPVQTEPQQVCVSTAQGTAYSPSPADGAVTPAQVGVWERIQTPKEPKNNLHMKLKLTTLDQKLKRPCVVQLVDVLRLPESEAKLQDAVAKLQDESHKTGWPVPKDLRRHQGLHTGHRLCCFTPCGDGVWQLQKVVAHSRDGYPCSICGKTFKHRKILRRHARFHTGEKPYSCQTCSKSFALRKSLRRHMRFHTGQRPHVCLQCGKSFRLRENLKAHLRFHTGEKPFNCTTCGKTFRIIKNLEKHQESQCVFFVTSFRTIAGL